MKVLSFLLTIIVLIVIYYSERKNIEAKKDGKVFLFLLGLASVLACIVIFFPKIPGPNQWVEIVFKPFIRT